MVLFEYAEALLLGHYYLTRSGFELAAEHTEEGRLSCAVCADNAVAVAVCEFKIYIFKKCGAAELHTHISYCYHIYSFRKSKFSFAEF